MVLDEPKDVDTATEHELFRSEISRETGRQTMISQTGRGDEILLMKWSGQCERAPFGGFPKLTTKF